jgi:hypothetical protein
VWKRRITKKGLRGALHHRTPFSHHSFSLEGLRQTKTRISTGFLFALGPHAKKNGAKKSAVAQSALYPLFRYSFFLKDACQRTLMIVRLGYEI